MTLVRVQISLTTAKKSIHDTTRWFQPPVEMITGTVYTGSTHFHAGLTYIIQWTVVVFSR